MLLLACRRTPSPISSSAVPDLRDKVLRHNPSCSFVICLRSNIPLLIALRHKHQLFNQIYLCKMKASTIAIHTHQDSKQDGFTFLACIPMPHGPFSEEEKQEGTFRMSFDPDTLNLGAEINSPNSLSHQGGKASRCRTPLVITHAPIVSPQPYAGHERAKTHTSLG